MASRVVVSPLLPLADAGPPPLPSRYAATPPTRLLVSSAVQRVGHLDIVGLSMRPDGGDRQPLTGSPTVPLAQVSPLAGRIVYSKTLSDVTFHGCGVAGCSATTFVSAGIAIAAADGSGERLLTHDGYDTEPSFSPDGRTIMYLRHQQRRGGWGEEDAIAFMDTDGTQQGALSPPSGYSYTDPTWSPDGRAVAVVRSAVTTDVPFGSQVVVLGLGSNPRVVATGGFTRLAWSHDGRSLAAFQAGQLWLIALDGGAPRQLTHLNWSAPSTGWYCRRLSGPVVELLGPVWSPDDSLIAFGSSDRHRMEFADPSVDIDVVQTDGSGLKVVDAARPARCDPVLYSVPERLTPLGWSGPSRPLPTGSIRPA